MTKDQEFFSTQESAGTHSSEKVTTPEASSSAVQAGSVAPESIGAVEKKDADYYTIKVPTLSKALKSLWSGGKKLAKKAEPVGDSMIDTLVNGIAKIAGLPDPKSGEQKKDISKKEEKTEKKTDKKTPSK